MVVVVAAADMVAAAVGMVVAVGLVAIRGKGTGEIPICMTSSARSLAVDNCL